MKKKIFGSIIVIVLLIITGLYIYIDNFEITSDDLPEKTEKKETMAAVKDDQQEMIIVDSVEDLIREKHLIMSGNDVVSHTDNQTALVNEESTQTEVSGSLEVQESTTSDIEASQEDSKVKTNPSLSQEEEKEAEKQDEKTLDDESIEAAKDDAKTTDKAQAMALAVKRLSPEQIKRLMTISKGGFTAEEKAEALEMFYENFTKEEQEWILLKFEEYMGG